MLVLLPFAAQATVTSVSPSPGQINLAVRGGSAVSVEWRVGWSATTGPAVVSSTTALLQINGATIANLGGSLSQGASSPPATQVLRFRETLNISPTLARRVATATPGSVTIVRVFAEGSAPGVAGTIQVGAGGGSGPLSMRRIELHFENDARTDVVRRGETLRAIAEINFRGNGLLRGSWVLSDPSTSLGGGRGRVLQVVRRQLSSSGEGRARIVSPVLPSDINGLYILTFSVSDTDGNIAAPVLRYFVVGDQASAAPTNISLQSPSAGSAVNTGTLFSWTPVPGANAYQVELLTPGTDDLVAGKLVPGNESQLNLSSLTFDSLTPGQNYDWRVRAFANGQVIGLSARSTLFIP